MKLVFVYNADSGAISALKDYVHKAVKPNTYDCRLCGVTYGSLGMKPRWKEFVFGIGVPVEFLHRDEFAEEYGAVKAGLPAVFLEKESGLELFIPSEMINRVSDLDGLIALVEDAVAELERDRS